MQKKLNKKKISAWKHLPVRLIVIVGQGKAGKDVLITYIKSRFRIVHHYRIADGPLKIIEALGLSPSRAILQKLFGVNALLYPILGESAYIRRVTHLIDSEKPRLAIVEAIRTKEEYEEFAKKRGGVLIGISAPDQVRYLRAFRDAHRRENREKKDEGEITFKEFMKRERLPIERDIRWIVGRADFILTNDSDDYPAFYKKIDAVMRELGISKKRGKAGVRRN